MNTLRLCAAIAAGAAGTVASADTIISNLAGPDGGGTLFGPAATTQFKAAGFTMTDSYFLDSVTLAIDAPDAGATAQVSIWSGATSPQTQLLSLTGPAFVGAGDYTFNAGGSLVLDAGDTYWIFVDNTNQSLAFNWDSTSIDPTGIGATAGGYIFNGNPSSFRNRFAVEGSLVPTPGGAGVLLLGSLVVTRRRR